MSDEEKKAIEVVNKRTERLIEELKIEEEDLIDEPKIAYLITQIEANKTLVNLIEKQSKEIEHQKEKRENQKKELAILNAKQIEFNKLVNTVNSYKGQFKRQQKEIEELKATKKELTERVLRLESDKFWDNVVSKDKIKAEIEEVDQWELYNMKIPRLSTLDERLGAKIGIKYVLQSLLEKE